MGREIRPEKTMALPSCLRFPLILPRSLCEAMSLG